MKKKLSLFTAFGVEIEYMIVDRDNLSVLPISDRLIYDVVGEYRNEIGIDHIAWSNEIVLHLIELKTNGPASSLAPLADYFHHDVQKINHLLEKYHAKLLPTGAHPWMNPYTEAKLWPHDDNVIYETYNKIFDCRGHGWSNLQSVHLNLPFANDEEFAKLHTAIRLLLPIIPAISASTPIVEGKLSGLLDTRLEFYRNNQQKIPSVTGWVIPEVVLSQKEYYERILNKMYSDIAPFDPNKIMQEEWLNSRGAIAYFDRNTIEIRVVDTQECPQADLAIIKLIVSVLKNIISEKWQSFLEQTNWSEERLQRIFLASIKEGLKAVLDDEDFLALFEFSKGSATIRELWQHILNEVELADADKQIINTILDHGNLAERIIASVNNNHVNGQLLDVYQQLADCLQEGRLYLP